MVTFFRRLVEQNTATVSIPVSESTVEYSLLDGKIGRSKLSVWICKQLFETVEQHSLYVDRTLTVIEHSKDHGLYSMDIKKKDSSFRLELIMEIDYITSGNCRKWNNRMPILRRMDLGELTMTPRTFQEEKERLLTIFNIFDIGNRIVSPIYVARFIDGKTKEVP